MQIITDLGSSLTGQIMTRLAERMGILSLKTTPYHPQANGSAERFIKFLCQCLTTFANVYRNNWNYYIDGVAFAYRTAPIEGTNVTPFELIYGRQAKLPFDVLYGPGFMLKEDLEKYGLELTDKLQQAFNIVRENRLKTIEKSKEKRLASHGHNVCTYKKGDRVLLFKPRRSLGASGKLASEWIGPYYIVKRITDVTYKIRLQRTGHCEIAHAIRLKKLLDDDAPYTFDTLEETQWEDILNTEEKAKAYTKESDAAIKVFKPKPKKKKTKAIQQQPIQGNATQEVLSQHHENEQVKPSQKEINPKSKNAGTELDENIDNIFYVSKIIREKYDTHGNRLLLVSWKPTISDKPLINKYKGYVARESRVHGNKFKTFWLQEWIPPQNFVDTSLLKEWDEEKAKRQAKRSKRLSKEPTKNSTLTL